MHRVLHILDHSLPEHDGYSFRSHSILTNLIRTGLNIDVITGPKQGPTEQDSENIDAVTYRRTPISDGESTAGASGQIRTIRLTRARIREHLSLKSIDVIHAHSPCLNGLAAIGLGIHLLYEMRSSWEDASVSVGATHEGSVRYRISRMLETYVAKKAAAIVVICEGLKEELVARGIRPDKITVVPNALPEEMFSKSDEKAIAAIRDRYALGGSKVVGFFGSFFEWEGVDSLLRAMPVVLAKEPTTKLLIAGGGRQEAVLHKLASDLNLRDSVVFAGRVSHDEIGACYAAADVMAYPRLPDRLTNMVTPLKPLEAMAMGTAVVASDVGGHKELIDDGETGILFAAGSHEDLARKILAVLGDPDGNVKMRAAAAEVVRKERRWSFVAERYVPIYEKLVSENKRYGRRMAGQNLARRIGDLLSPAGRRGRLAVFCYHHVLESPDEFRSGEPTATEFSDDVETIASTFNTLTFDESVTKLREGTLPARAACITFDDGYENNHSLAAPILEKAGVPATFFVAGGAIDEGIMWNDLVIEAIAGAGGDPTIPAEIEFLTLPDSAQNQSEVVAALLSQIKYRPINERWDISAKLYSENCGSELPRLMMSREMVKDLATRGFEVGGHTINHPILKELSDDSARVEIHRCRQWVKTVTGIDPKSFAYPNGRTGIDFDERHSEMVAEAGFSAAATTDWRLASSKTPPFSVPRVGPWWRQGRSLESGLIRSYLKTYL